MWLALSWLVAVRAANLFDAPTIAFGLWQNDFFARPPGAEPAV